MVADGPEASVGTSPEGRPMSAAPSAELNVRAAQPGTPVYFSAGHSSTGTPALGFLVCIGVLIGPLGLLGTILGWVAFAQIRNSGGAIVGKGLALFNGLFYPILTLVLLVIALALA